MEMTILSTALALIILLVDIWAIASIWRTTKTQGTKMAWTGFILLFPVIGFVIWGIAGPRGIAEPPTSDEHSKG